MTARRPKTLEEAIQTYADPEACKKLLVQLRWPEGRLQCPVCGSEKLCYLRIRHLWRCSAGHARDTFSLKTGTLFQNSAVALDKWLPVIWMLANSTGAAKSQDVHRLLGVTQKTAWLMLERIKHAIEANDLYGGVDLHDIFRLSRKPDPAEWRAWNRAKDRRGEMVEGIAAYGRFCRVLQAALWVPYEEVRRRVSSGRT